MTRSNAIARYAGEDDKPLPLIRRDISGGANSRQHGANIAENQMTVLYNIDIGVPGDSRKRPGSVLIGADNSNDSVIALHDYQRQGYTDNLMSIDGNTLRASEGEAAQTTVKSDFTASLTDYGICSIKESGKTPDDVIIVQNGTDNAVRCHKNAADAWATADLGDGNTSPPKTTVMCWYGNRLWCLKNDLLYYSDAYDSDYSTSFDRTTNSFRIPVGQERFVVATRDSGMVIAGKNAIWALFPSATPAATDRPQPLLSMGCVSKKGYAIVNDDIYFFAQDGLRALKRTLQDKLQVGASYPISYRLKTEFETIAWDYIDRLSMVYWDNKLFITVPTSSSAFDTWVYYPATDAFMIIQGWSPRCWATHKISGAERLYYGKHGDGDVYRAWTGYADEGTTATNGTAINYQEEGRKEDFGQPLIKKCGGTIRIKAYSSGNYDLTISVSADDASYTTLGTMNLTGNAPALPISLPFSLAGENLVDETFHLDSLGEYYQVRLKIQHNAANGSDDIRVFERTIIAYPVEYQHE